MGRRCRGLWEVVERVVSDSAWVYIFRGVYPFKVVVGGSGVPPGIFNGSFRERGARGRVGGVDVMGSVRAQVVPDMGVVFPVERIQNVVHVQVLLNRGGEECCGRCVGGGADFSRVRCVRVCGEEAVEDCVDHWLVGVPQVYSVGSYFTQTLVHEVAEAGGWCACMCSVTQDSCDLVGCVEVDLYLSGNGYYVADDECLYTKAVVLFW